MFRLLLTTALLTIAIAAYAGQNSPPDDGGWSTDKSAAAKEYDKDVNRLAYERYRRDWDNHVEFGEEIYLAIHCRVLRNPMPAERFVAALGQDALNAYSRVTGYGPSSFPADSKESGRRFRAAIEKAADPAVCRKSFPPERVLELNDIFR